jgi:hypothetical protein
MQPTSESTKLEGAHGFVEYQAAGKLKGKKAFITGGEYVIFFPTFFLPFSILLAQQAILVRASDAQWPSAMPGREPMSP